jgi:6-phosphogluconolactonase
METASREFDDSGSLARALADFVAERLQERLSRNGEASLIVSGGRSPIAFFAELSRKPLDWRRVTVSLADERWVAPDHPDSNENFVRKNLLVANAAEGRLLPLWNDAPTAEAAAVVASKRLRELPRPFDAVVLGMGEDGHTASLFPDAPELAEALDPAAAPACVAITPGQAPHRRLTLNRRALLDSRCIALQVQGAAKGRTLSRALTPGPVAELPVRAVLLQSKVPCHVFRAC